MSDEELPPGVEYDHTGYGYDGLQYCDTPGCRNNCGDLARCGECMKDAYENQTEDEKEEFQEETVVDITGEQLQKLTNKGKEVKIEKEDQIITLRTSDFYHRIGGLE